MATPDEIITTEKPGDEENIMGDNIISQNRYRLESTTLRMNRNKSFLVIAASDGLIKMVDNKMDKLQQAFHYGLLHSKTPNDVITYLTKSYSQNLYDRDDTTLSMAICGNLKGLLLKEWAATWKNNPKLTRLDTQ